MAADAAPRPPNLTEVAATFRAPVAPELFARLEAVPGYLAHVWPVLKTSIDTEGFIGSALYMADMALDAVEEAYEPVLSPEVLCEVVPPDEIAAVEQALDVFHYLQPQALLAGAALAEAFDRPSVGGAGRAVPRAERRRGCMHLQAAMPEPVGATPLTDAVAELLQLDAAPQLYSVLASWPSYLEVAWDELQHLAAYPNFRRRGRALYFYARSGSQFLAEELRADAVALRAAGIEDAEIEAARAIVDASLPALATMVMHVTAMRLALGHREREVVTG